MAQGAGVRACPRQVRLCLLWRSGHDGRPSPSPSTRWHRRCLQPRGLVRELQPGQGGMGLELPRWEVNQWRDAPLFTSMSTGTSTRRS
jgi:hypothetical protein